MKKFYIGTYTEPILFGTGEVLYGKGEGIYSAELDRKGVLKLTGLAAEARNPSFVAVSKDGRYLFAVGELKKYQGEEAGCVSCFRILDEQLGLQLADQRSTHGQDPCHVAVFQDKLVVSNFMTGSVCCYEIGEDGRLMERAFVQHKGSGPDPVRQKGPHAHSCIGVPGMDRVIVPDLGLDRLMVYELEDGGGVRFREEESYRCLPGSGPRFGVFNKAGDRLYVINELGSALTVLNYSRDTGKMESIQQISTLPEPCENICADVHLTEDGRFLYASNRGHDSITGFRVLEDGRLEQMCNIPCGGKTPRNFAIEPEGRYLLVGNQDTNEIVVFAIDGETGTLREVSRTKVPTPVCICGAW